MCSVFRSCFGRSSLSLSCKSSLCVLGTKAFVGCACHQCFLPAGGWLFRFFTACFTEFRQEASTGLDAFRVFAHSSSGCPSRLEVPSFRNAGLHRLSTDTEAGPLPPLQAVVQRRGAPAGMWLGGVRSGAGLVVGPGSRRGHPLPAECRPFPTSGLWRPSQGGQAEAGSPCLTPTGQPSLCPVFWAGGRGRPTPFSLRPWHLSLPPVLRCHPGESLSHGHFMNHEVGLWAILLGARSPLNRPPGPSVAEPPSQDASSQRAVRSPRPNGPPRRHSTVWESRSRSWRSGDFEMEVEGRARSSGGPLRRGPTRAFRAPTRAVCVAGGPTP